LPLIAILQIESTRVRTLGTYPKLNILWLINNPLLNEGNTFLQNIRREIYFIYNIIGATFICLSILMTLISLPLFISAFRK
jgi:hypothetical protein